MQKIKIGHRAKFRDKHDFLPEVFISVSRDFTPYFHFRCVASATFDRNLTYFLVMACVGYLRAQLKTLSSLLNMIFTFYILYSGSAMNVAYGPVELKKFLGEATRVSRVRQKTGQSKLKYCASV